MIPNSKTASYAVFSNGRKYDLRPEDWDAILAKISEKSEIYAGSSSAVAVAKPTLNESGGAK
ncbi:MAG: hypothetical protein IPJ71_14360 [Bdellovibrionales bacterium]|nr:hypothetical protein [Bdellovibrionales bacterium]